MIRPNLLAASAIVTLSGGAMAATPRSFMVPPSSLEAAILVLGRQAGVDIVSTEPDLRTVRVQGIAGTMTVEGALARLLRGTGLHAIRIDARSYRIERRRKAARPAVVKPPPSPSPTLTDIVVTATKRPAQLLRFPGSVTVVGLASPDGGAAAAKNSVGEIAAMLPIMQQTELGPGRNKLFIRGIADSSFNGPTQSTVSVYFGDVQLGYNGPDPDLQLHDIDRVEILEGPQGTLYGSGAIGGIIRIVPNAVNVERNEVSTSVKTVFTQGAGVGHDVGAALNLALPSQRAGVRAVIYDRVDGGYIDDLVTGRNNINRTHISGGRLTGRVLSSGGWDIELGALYQHIENRDRQYVTGRPSADTVFPEPSHSDFAQFRVVVNRQWDNGVHLVAASGFVQRHSQELFDASRLVGGSAPSFYWSHRRNHSFSQEIRLYRNRDHGLSWLVGGALLDSRERQTRELGRDGAAEDIVGVMNRTRSAALFSEASWAFSSRLSVTGGGRLTVARTDSDPLDSVKISRYVRGIETTRFDPTLAISWLALPGLSVYGRFQTGFRTGGLAVARGIGRVANFRPDAMSVLETGMRYMPSDSRLPTLNLALSYAHWEDIQADLIDRRGFPYTATIGNARIWSFEASTNWSPTPRWKVGAALLYSYNRIYGPMASQSPRDNRRLAETPPLALSGQINYRLPIGQDSLLIGANAHYVGRSILGTGPFFDMRQGDFAFVSGAMTWRHRTSDLTIAVDNLLNSSANRFAFGNPFLLRWRDQDTPLRPRTISLKMSTRW